MTVSKKKNFKTPDLEDMVRIFRECGLSPPREVMNGFWRFHQLLRERDAELDLTRLKAFESMVVKHYVDSAIVADLIDLPSPLLDIGTGPGFPGLPLKMVRPDLHVILAESRGKRLAFLEEAIELLDLKGVDIYPHKVTPAFPGRVEGVITRDLESIEKTLERASGFLGAGGRVIFMKGPAADPEITAALAAHGRTFTLTTDRAYSLGQTGLKRRLLVFKRTAGGVGPRKKEPESMIKEIASEANPNFKVWRKILEPRGIRKHGRGIISGLKNVREVLRDFPESCVCVLGLEPEVPPIFGWKPEIIIGSDRSCSNNWTFLARVRPFWWSGSRLWNNGPMVSGPLAAPCLFLFRIRSMWAGSYVRPRPWGPFGWFCWKRRPILFIPGPCGLQAARFSGCRCSRDLPWRI